MLYSPGCWCYPSRRWKYRMIDERSLNSPQARDAGIMHGRDRVMTGPHLDHLGSNYDHPL